jgi:MFS family permease
LTLEPAPPLIETTDTRPHPEGAWSPGVRLLTASLVINVTLVAFESLAVATILPVVSAHLGDFRLYGWVFSAFFLSSLLGIVAAGAVADRRGVAIPVVGGLAVFGVGLVVAGLAPNMPVLVLGRVIQGLGAGSVPAAAYVAISRVYPAPIRPRMFAILSTAWVVPGIAGPVVAAQVAAHAGWRWVFLGLVPLTVAAVALTIPSVGMVPPPARTGSDPGPDPARALVPALGVTAGAALILVALTAAGPGVLNAGATVGLTAVGMALLIPSLRRLTPPKTLVAGRGLPATVAIRGLLTFAYFAGDAYVPLTLTAVRHTSTTYAGLTLTVATMTWTVASWVQARLIDRTGPRRLIRAGVGLVLAGLAALGSILVPSIPLWVAPLAWGMSGFGIGLAYSSLSVTALGWAPAGQEGRVSSGLQLTDVLGTALGTGVAGAAVAVAEHNHGSSRVGLAVAFGLAAASSVVALAVSHRLPRRTSPAT